ncbi:GDSL-type esterase/lipase family protein [Pseudofrankia asymbiotica]|uniref:GDSL family lipase n=1 Tax=Pseudofrankia asymbiotica TaxID=1834516 RepID=A0A1V2IC63_9ACTN|nr:GDSL-type esterase/lipase family protein [Pseudofrankia asymbiotica]ONH29743.1 GDSL family lipase [Pseudofrankia asymbiotica]
MTVLDDTLERTDPDCLTPAEEAALLRAAPWRRLVVLGDSIAAGVREPRAGYRDLCFADRLAAALADGRKAPRDRPHRSGEPGDARHLDYLNLDYLNLGVPWACLTDVRDGQLPAALRFEPDLALIAAGGNDTLRPDYDPDRAWRELLDIALPLADRGVLVVTIGLFDLARSGLVSPRTGATMASRLDRLDVITAAVAAQVGGLHVDTHHHPRAADPAIFASDRVHANAAGHAIASAAIIRTLAARLGDPDAGQRVDRQ